MLLLLICLVVLVVFVNGWTDAPNAITCMVATGVLSYKKAVRLAAVCNLAGLLVMGGLNAAVANSIAGLIRLDASNPQQAAAVLCGAMAAVVLFAVGAWFFGIPTSESHALVAALTGAALAMGNPSAINPGSWAKVLWGLGFSLVLGLFLGWGITKLLKGPLGKASEKTLNRIQIFSGAGMAFMHGSQDGQKFVAIFVMARCLAGGLEFTAQIRLQEHFPELFICAFLMALGTMAGGKRIISHVGNKMVHMQKYQGACADLGGVLCLFLASVQGIPMSTTHTKTTAIMGAGIAAGSGQLNFSVVRRMLMAWLITFPVCAMLGYLIAAWLLP